MARVVSRRLMRDVKKLLITLKCYSWINVNKCFDGDVCIIILFNKGFAVALTMLSICLITRRIHSERCVCLIFSKFDYPFCLPLYKLCANKGGVGSIPCGERIVPWSVGLGVSDFFDWTQMRVEA